MATRKTADEKAEDRTRILSLIARAKKYRHDPLGFVKKAFRWNSDELAGHAGPDTWQEDILNQCAKLGPAEAMRIAVASGHGIGKAQPHDTVIDTPSGPRKFGTLAIGDLVFGGDGSPTKIIGIHEQGVIPVYRVAFDDRSSTRVCGEHLWNVKGRNHRRTEGDWETISTKEILKRGVLRKNGKSAARQWEIPRQGICEFPYRWVPIDPYTLGAWLGDGARNTPSITSMDDEVDAHIKSAGYLTGKTNKKNNRSSRITIYPDLGRWLRQLGLIHKYSYQKAVPDMYKYNLSLVRAEVLRGLLDTDGFISAEGAIIFSSASEALTNDVIWLARSLGGKALLHRNPKATSYRRRDGTRVDGKLAHVCTIRMPVGFGPCYIERKNNRVKASHEPRYAARWIASIEADGEAECRCITVAAPDGLYLTNDFIVTHNSALVCWIILWAMITFEGTKGVITANTETQLRTKTWAELAKWYQLCEWRDCLTFQATSIFSSLEEHEKTWRIDMVPWSERSTEAFAGLHNQNKRIILIFDEASAIPDIIWETSQGALTDANTEILWCAFGNPTRPSGRFFECFNKYRHRWECRQIDSRNCRLSNKDEIDGWVKDEGEDSDYIRIRVRGIFPRRGSMQFIDSDLVKAAVAREGQAYSFDAFILGMDIARYGDDASRIVQRRGRDAKTWAARTMRGVDLMTQASVLIQMVEEGRPDAVFIDEGGVGGGVIDRARQLGYNPIGVQFGGSATNGMTGDGKDLGRYANKRAEMWGAMREWLKVGAIPNDMDLIADLTSIEYTFNARDEILLEKKEDMKRRGLASPDYADALALTFAFPVYPRSAESGRRGHTSESNPFPTTEVPQ